MHRFVSVNLILQLDNRMGISLLEGIKEQSLKLHYSRPSSQMALCKASDTNPRFVVDKALRSCCAHTVNSFKVAPCNTATWKIAEACGYTLRHHTEACGGRPFWLNPCRSALGVSLPHPSPLPASPSAAPPSKNTMRQISVYSA